MTLVVELDINPKLLFSHSRERRKMKDDHLSKSKTFFKMTEEQFSEVTKATMYLPSLLLWTHDLCILEKFVSQVNFNWKKISQLKILQLFHFYFLVLF